MGLCKLTGTALAEGYTTTLCKMCLNCEFAIENEDGTFACTNDNVLEKGRKAILASVPEGFEISSLELKPMALKNPAKKCGNYRPDKDVILNVVNEAFGL